MKNSFKITRVVPMFNSKRPMIVIELDNAPTIFRHPKLALIDLHNSGRCLKVPQSAIENGIAFMHPIQQEQFFSALKDCEGAIVTGDTTIFKAGDKYAVTAGHPALTDVNHPAFGIKEGEFLVAEKGGHRVEGFLEIPFTAQEKMMKMMIEQQGANALLAMFNISAPAVAVPAVAVPEPTAVAVPNVSPEDAFDSFEEYEEETEEIATKTKATKAPAMKAALGN